MAGAKYIEGACPGVSYMGQIKTPSKHGWYCNKRVTRSSGLCGNCDNMLTRANDRKAREAAVRSRIAETQALAERVLPGIAFHAHAGYITIDREYLEIMGDR
jgi:hypothetical protein